MNAEFQRIARRDKKVFLSDQCKEIEENNRMEKPRDLFKKIRDTKGTFHAKTGSIKDRNGKDLREAEEIKRRWQEYTQELYKKDHDLNKYTQLNTKFQRITREDKTFFNEQCKEVEANNRMGKPRDLFKKTGVIKGIFCANMGSKKD